MGEHDNRELTPPSAGGTVETIETEVSDSEVTDLRVGGEGFSADGSFRVEADLKIRLLESEAVERWQDWVPKAVRMADDGGIVVTLTSETQRAVPVGRRGGAEPVAEANESPSATKANGVGRTGETNSGNGARSPKNGLFGGERRDTEERSAPRVRVVLRSEEAERIVEALEWYVENRVSSELAARYRDIAEMVQRIADTGNPTSRNQIALSVEEAERINEALETYEDRAASPRTQAHCHRIRTKVRSQMKK